MPSNTKFNYVTGSSARKYEYLDDYPKEEKKNIRRASKKTVVNEKVKVKTVFFISCLFVMLMIITYRFNVISESNLALQNLKIELERVQSNLAATEMNVEQSTDLAKIEAYAKQKLGMQKPDKNQVVYIDTSKDTNVVKEDNVSFVDEIIENIKGYINNIK
ncbi:MAG: Cell division protein FtsL [Clostridia bacterium]|jgi:cell division protein FtsB|nr:Cell division protein FtsL [Clostridia bacterium]